MRRESITEAAGKLQQAGIIDYRRGHIELKDRVRLETIAGECYGVMKEESIRLVTDFQAASYGKYTVKIFLSMSEIPWLT